MACVQPRRYRLLPVFCSWSPTAGRGSGREAGAMGMRRALMVPLMGPIPLALPPSPHPVLTPALCGPPLPQHRALLLGSPSPCRASFSGLLQAHPPCHPTVLSNGAFHGPFLPTFPVGAQALQGGFWKSHPPPPALRLPSAQTLAVQLMLVSDLTDSVLRDPRSSPRDR